MVEMNPDIGNQNNSFYTTCKILLDLKSFWTITRAEAVVEKLYCTVLSKVFKNQTLKGNVFFFSWFHMYNCDATKRNKT